MVSLFINNCLPLRCLGYSLLLFYVLYNGYLWWLYLCSFFVWKHKRLTSWSMYQRTTVHNTRRAHWCYGSSHESSGSWNETLYLLKTINMKYLSKSLFPKGFVIKPRRKFLKSRTKINASGAKQKLANLQREVYADIFYLSIPYYFSEKILWNLF